MPLCVGNSAMLENKLQHFPVVVEIFRRWPLCEKAIGLMTLAV